MSQLGPPSAMGGAAPLNAPPSEQTLSIRVACEGTDCNALLEVNVNLVDLLSQRKRDLAV